jgi:hypothetical protein
MTQTPDPKVKDVPVGTVVIHAESERPYEYRGRNDDSLFTQIIFDFRTAHNGIRTTPDRVAPAEEVGDPARFAKDPRIAVEKRKTAYGEWVATVLGQRFFSKTKRDALADATRALAIHEWHQA